MNVVCTIITGNYGHYALALHDSIIQFNENQHFAVFISNGELDAGIVKEINKRDNFSVYKLSDLNHLELALKLKNKYHETYHDAYRWGMKPVFMSFLLNNDYENVIYVDSDIFFFNDYTFLFNELESSSVLLSPHWRCSNPEVDFQNFKLNFLDGMYNGGFVGVSKEGISAMEYWAELCLFNCEVNRENGFFVDQKYLDILSSRFENVSSIHHKGCNVANWNQIDCKRTKGNDVVLINAEFPIIFIHFTNSFLDGVLIGSDKILKPYLEIYKNALLNYSDNNIMERFLEKKEALKKRKALEKKSNIKTIIKKVNYQIKLLKQLYS